MLHPLWWTREVDEDNEAAPWKEQENWEGEQIAKASMAVGAKDKPKQAQQYDYVFEDQIDFITDMALAGDVVRCSLLPVLHCPGMEAQMDSWQDCARALCGPACAAPSNWCMRPALGAAPSAGRSAARRPLRETLCVHPRACMRA